MVQSIEFLALITAKLSSSIRFDRESLRDFGFRSHSLVPIKKKNKCYLILIFLDFRSLKCARITIHMNLFASFAANNSLWLLWYRIVIGDPDVIQQNEVIHLLFYRVFVSFVSLSLQFLSHYQIGWPHFIHLSCCRRQFLAIVDTFSSIWIWFCGEEWVSEWMNERLNEWLW